MACNFYNPAKGICMAKFEKYGKEDLAVVTTCGTYCHRPDARYSGKDYCRFDTVEGHDKCQDYIEKTKK